MSTTMMAYANLLPGRNPSGAGGTANGMPAIGSSSGTNPVLPTTNLPAGAPQANPYDPTSVVPTFGANSGPYTPTNLATPAPTGGNNSSPALGAPGSGPGLTGMTQTGLNDMYHELNKTYGEGVASAIMQFLIGGAGFNQNAINNQFAALQPGINQGEEQLMNQFSTSGNRFGSGAQIGLADYLSQVNLNEGQIESQEYEQSVQNYMDTLLGVGSANATRAANSPSTLDNILSGLQLGGTAASAISNAGVGGTAGSILDIIGSFGA